MPKKKESYKARKRQQSSAKCRSAHSKDESIKGPSTDPQGTPGNREEAAFPVLDAATVMTEVRLGGDENQRDKNTQLQNDSTQHVTQPSGVSEMQMNLLDSLPGLTELALWKVSEVISPHRILPLGLRLGLHDPKLRNIIASSIQQEEKTFRMFYDWDRNQEGDQSKFLFRVLTSEEKLDQEEVFDMFFEKQHICQGFFGRDFQDFQLHEIAEELHVDKLIPLSLRLGLTYSRIYRVREDSKSHSVNVCYAVMMLWRKEQTSQIDQFESLASVMEACQEKKLAYQIRQNHFGVTNENKTLLISEERPMEGLGEVQLNVSHANKLVREEAQGRLQAVLEAGFSETSVALSPGGEIAEFLKGLKECSLFFKRHSAMVKSLEKTVGRDGMYKLIGLTVDSIHFHVKVYTMEGLHALQMDIQSGRIGHDLGKVLLSEETKQQFTEDIVLDVTSEGGAWNLLSSAVNDLLPSNTSPSTELEPRQELKVDRAPLIDLLSTDKRDIEQATVHFQEEEHSEVQGGCEEGSLRAFISPSRQEMSGDVTLKGRDVETHAETPSAGKAPRRMEDWTEEEVADWLKTDVHFSDEIVRKFEGVDGYTLVWYTSDDLKDDLKDYGLAPGYCRRLLIKRQHYLEKEQMHMEATPKSVSSKIRYGNSSDSASESVPSPVIVDSSPSPSVSSDSNEKFQQSEYMQISSSRATGNGSDEGKKQTTISASQTVEPDAPLNAGESTQDMEPECSPSITSSTPNAAEVVSPLPQCGYPEMPDDSRILEITGKKYATISASQTVESDALLNVGESTQGIEPGCSPSVTSSRRSATEVDSTLPLHGYPEMPEDSRLPETPGRKKATIAGSQMEEPDAVESTQGMEPECSLSFTSSSTTQVDSTLPLYGHPEVQETLHASSETVGMDKNSNTEKRLANLLLGSDKGELDSSYYPVLVVNTPSQLMNSAEVGDQYGFMASVNWNVVFDCNADSNKVGLCQYVNQRKSIKILNADKFTETKDVDQLREQIDFPEIPVWVFPNGRNDVNVKGMDKLSDIDWMRERSHAVLNTVRFFSDPGVIPPGRAVVVFLLLSYSDIMVMTQLFREFYTSKSFQDLKRFTIIAEDRGVLHRWIQHLESQCIVSSKNMMERCLGGVKWQEINTYMMRLLGSCETGLPVLPMVRRGQCELMKKHQSQWSDITVLAKNECENTSMDESNPNFLDFVQEKESRFYQGHGVDWWNFYLSEDKLNRGKGYNHVLKRQNYTRLHDNVLKILASPGKKVDHISMATVFHEPGAGGTTVAKNLLWDFHQDHRCAVVNRVTNDTVTQIVAFHKYGYEEGQKPGPVVLLLENLESEIMRSFLISLERETRYLEDNGVAFVLIHCKRTSDPQLLLKKEESKLCVCIEHKLTNREKCWFTEKTKDLEKRKVFNEESSPELLLAFMVMKKECAPDYLKDVVKAILPRVDSKSNKSLLNAVNLLKYIAVVQLYNPDFAMPVSACDGFMQTQYRVTSTGQHRTLGPWEKNREPFLNLLLLEEFIQDIDGCVKGLKVVHPVIANEIVHQLGEQFQQRPADMILELLEKSSILDTLSYSKGYIQKVCRDLMVRRLKKEYGDDKETDFAPFIEDVYEEDREKAFKIMEVGIKKFKDPFIAQQKARLHSKKEDDSDNAEKAINIALGIVKNNSYLWDTKGIILRQKMAKYERRVDQEFISDHEMQELLHAFKESCLAFQEAQKAMEEEARRRNYAGFVGEIFSITKLLEIVEKRVRPFCYRGKGLEILRKYLMTEFIPSELNLPSLREFSDTMKSLSERIDILLDRFTDYLSQCAQQRFSGSPYRLYDDKLEKIYSARNKYFVVSPKRFEDVSEKMHYTVETAYAMRRSEVKMMNADGYQQIFDMASQQKVGQLKKVQALLRQNLGGPSLFDIRNYVFTIFALSVCSKEELNEEDARKSVNILKTMEAEKDRGFYGLFFEMLLNWPDGTPGKRIVPIGKTIRQLEIMWKERYRNREFADSRHNLPRRSKIRQNHSPLKALTEFYLGLESEKSRFVHRKSIGRITYDIWKEDSIKKRLKRLDGVLDSKHFVLYNPDGEEPMKIPLSLPIKGLPSQEPVQFYLGFSFAGPLAYDVVYKDNRETPFIAKESSANYPSYVNELHDIEEGSGSYEF
ncbi:sterile alpha motif domain-containing protein 9-like [Lytechinus variegatus]|uniref:sterile alpha motif domain-containing protein 9-like n=1 Tax=Lytechinus variegatus TaxID=7654 RepID=UPI001BB19F38|nr:sterile alpha motif domain-containing protein 9-like [Lytechinus variegatus]